METLKAFAEKVQSDESLQNEIKKLSEANDQDGIIALAKSNGVPLLHFSSLVLEVVTTRRLPAYYVIPITTRWPVYYELICRWP